MKQYNANESGDAINENGEILRLASFPHFDGNYWYEFDTDEERYAFIAANTPAPVWDKEAYANEVNADHNALFQKLYEERNYITIGEIPIWENDAEFGDESLALQNWWIDTCKIVENYLSTVTEATIIDNFIDTLPKLNLNG